MTQSASSLYGHLPLGRCCSCPGGVWLTRLYFVRCTAAQVHLVSGIAGLLVPGVFAGRNTLTQESRRAGLLHGGSFALAGVQILATLSLVVWAVRADCLWQLLMHLRA